MLAKSGVRLYNIWEFALEVLGMKAWNHFKTITGHRWLVCKGCFRVGLYWQGLTHDLSKYTPAEFSVGARLWSGKRSPNTYEREIKGYSEAWMHHKGRNKHHFEYWTDLSRDTGKYESVPMPRKYLAEMVMDRIAACKVYQGNKYTDDSAIKYLDSSREKWLMCDQLRQELSYLLTMLAEEGEEKTFHYIKHKMLKGHPFPWETEE